MPALYIVYSLIQSSGAKANSAKMALKQKPFLKTSFR